MKVYCLIHRTDGSSVTLGDRTYKFNGENGHCCEVEDKDHLAIFSKIKTFRLAEPLEASQRVVLRRKSKATRY